MSVPANRWKLGLFVLLGITVLFAGLTWLGVSRLQRRMHEWVAFFDEAVNGLEDGSPVKFRGLQIGVVALRTVAPDKKHLEVHANLYDDVMQRFGIDLGQEPDSPGPPGLRAQLVSSFVTGTSFVQVDYFDDGPAGAQKLTFEVPRNTIRTVPSTIKSLEEGVRDLLRELPGLLSEAKQLLSAVRADLTAAKLPDLSRRIERLVAAAEERVQQLDQMPAVRSATAAFDQVAALARSWNDEAGPVRAAARELAALATDLRAALQAADLGATAATLRATSDDVGAALRAAMPRLHSVLAAIERLAELLERDPGSVLHGRTGTPSPIDKKE
ncbi:MAG TPA: MlaD family protein [Planctomycetota bacterium]|nr:MlaD family protein [Planctomycetota bacterium]